VDPGFLVQTSLAEDRDRPLTTAQAALIQRIPLEPTSLHHGRGTVTFTHAEGDPDGGISALSILLGDAPQLDGKYVILGRVEDGYDVLDEIASVPLNARGQPLIHVGIQRAEIVTAAEAAAQRISRRALYSAGMAYEQEGMRSEVKGLVCAILFGVMAMSLLAARLSRRLYTAARLLILLGGGFGVMLVLLPRAQRFPLLGAALMAGLVALFKLLGRFEEPADEEAPSPSQPALSHSSYARKS
ncbi:MAG: peptidylprolyl isomerase, partial [Myxococcales bacterium]